MKDLNNQFVYTAEFSNAFKKSYKKLVKQDKDLGEVFALSWEVYRAF